MKKYKINKDLFRNNNNIVFSHFKMNWKLILFFILFWFFISLLSMLYTLKNHSWYSFPFSFSATKPMIAPNHYYWNDPYSGVTETITSTTAISSILNYILFGTPAIILFSIVGIFYINKIFLTSVNTGKIVFWTTLPLSRNQIMFSKYLFIIFTLFTIFMPSYILIVIFSSFSYDASEYIGNVILYGFQFFIFIVFFISIFSLISIALIENKLTANIIMSMILLWTVTCAILFLIYQLSYFPGEHSSTDSFKNFQYFSLQYLLIRPLNFTNIDLMNPSPNDPVFKTINKDGTKYDIFLETSSILPANKLLLISLTITMPVISSGIVFLNNYIFRQKDLNI